MWCSDVSACDCFVGLRRRQVFISWSFIRPRKRGVKPWETDWFYDWLRGGPFPKSETCVDTWGHYWRGFLAVLIQGRRVLGRDQCWIEKGKTPEELRSKQTKDSLPLYYVMQCYARSHECMLQGLQGGSPSTVQHLWIAVDSCCTVFTTGFPPHIPNNDF